MDRLKIKSMIKCWLLLQEYIAGETKPFAEDKEINKVGIHRRKAVGTMRIIIRLLAIKDER